MQLWFRPSGFLGRLPRVGWLWSIYREAELTEIKAHSRTTTMVTSCLLIEMNVLNWWKKKPVSLHRIKPHLWGGQYVQYWMFIICCLVYIGFYEEQTKLIELSTTCTTCSINLCVCTWTLIIAIRFHLVLLPTVLSSCK